MKYIIFCESQTHMDLLAQSINDISFNHISVLKKVADKVGGPMQRPIQYPDRVAIFESDLEEPFVLRGATDLITVAERQELLNLRAQNANLLRLVGRVLQIFYHDELCVY